MNKRHPITAFYVEALIMILVFVGIILVLTQVFGAGQALSSDADQLTKAVGMARNAAEAVAASEDPEELAKTLDEGNIGTGAAPTAVQAYYDKDGNPAKDGIYRVEATWEPEPAGSGEMVKSHIPAYYDDNDEPVYTLDTASYRGEGSE